MFSKGNLAQCSNRSILARTNPLYGEPTDWFNNSLSEKYSFRSVSFDFFINWNNIEITTNICWYKLITEKNLVDITTLSDEIINYVGKNILTSYVNLFQSLNLVIKFLIIPDDQKYNDESELYYVEFDNKLNSTISLINLKELKNDIQEYSGGPIRIGNKGLIYGTSNLECYLSHTTSLYPGDLDLLIYNSDTYEPSLILEFKKHNLNTPLINQKLSNYYPIPDARKYNRLHHFRNKFLNNTPICILYYSTNAKYDSFLIELIVEDKGTLVSKKKAMVKFENLKNDIISSIIKWCK